jgi:iron complex transport system permease protein
MAATTVTRDIDADAGARFRHRPLVIVVGGLVALLVLLVLGVGLGSVRIGPLDTIGVILWRAFGIDTGVTWSSATEAIVWDLRLPRVLTAMIIGCVHLAFEWVFATYYVQYLLAMSMGSLVGITAASQQQKRALSRTRVAPTEPDFVSRPG